MQKSAIITVLLSVHNGADTLDRCLESISLQTLTDFDILCIDDCSHDHTLEILRKWQRVFGEDRFRIIANETNLGLTRSLNSGLAKIDTTYAARIDADDWWAPQKLEQQVRFLEHSPECGVIGTAYANISPAGEKQVFPPTEDRDLKKYMFRHNPFAHSAVVFRTELVRSNGGYDGTLRYGQDYELWLRISPITKFANLPDILCFREAGSERSISYEKQNEQMWQCLKTQHRYLRLLKRPLWEYLYMVDPFIALITPAPIRRLKRKWL